MFAIIGGLATMAIGLGAYAFLGRPALALNSLTTPSKTDYPALISMLAKRMPDRPGDVEGWTLLGKGYLTLGQCRAGRKGAATGGECATD